jgi:porin
MGFAGVVWQGAIPGRNKDNILMSAYTGAFSSSYARKHAKDGGGWATAETVLEWAYVIQVTPNLQLQPDIQWIIQPMGLRSIPNALVIGCQVGLAF